MKNILKNFWVTLTRFRVASVLNLLGLSIAFAVFIILASQVWWELSYNRSIPDHERIYRVLGSVDADKYWPSVSRPMGEKLGISSPAVESYGTFIGFNDPVFNRLNSDKEFIHGTYRASYGVPSTFGLKCLEGRFEDFNSENTVILPLTLSQKLFEVEESPVGELILCGGDTLRVVAVYEPLPSNNRINDMALVNIGDLLIDDFGHWSFSYYYKLKEGVDHNAALAEMIELTSNDIKEKLQMPELTHDIVRFEAVGEEYFSPIFPMGGNMTVTLISIIIAIIIIALAIINYLNFFMSLVPIRIRAVNINKVFGAPVAALRANIIFEALLFMLLSYAISVVWIQLASQSYIAELFRVPISVTEVLYPLLLGVGLIILLGLVIGLFPAFYITKFKPTLVLKGSFGRSKSGRVLRAGLSAVQFVVSFVFAVIALFIILQNNYLREYDYGFDRDRVVTMSLQNSNFNLETFRKELLKSPMIENASLMMGNIVNEYPAWSYTKDKEGAEKRYTALYCDAHTLDVLGIEVLEGEAFRDDMGGGKVIINKSMQEAYDLKVGDIIDGVDMEVVGVVGDVHASSLRDVVAPMAFITTPENIKPYAEQLYMRLSPTAKYSEVEKLLRNTLQDLDANSQAQSRRIVPLNQHIEEMYGKEQSNEELVTLFSIVTFIISLMGIFGMVLFDMQHRYKEIALRKVYGSTVWGLLVRFNRSVLTTLLVSFVVAVPLALWGTNWWLESFSYRVPLYWWVFVIVFVVITTLVIAVVTFQCYSVANRNPIQSLKSE